MTKDKFLPRLNPTKSKKKYESRQTDKHTILMVLKRDHLEKDTEKKVLISDHLFKSYVWKFIEREGYN